MAVNDYAQWYAELHPSETGFEVTRKITAHLATRIIWGNAVIVCETPYNLVPTFKTRWESVLQVIEAQYVSSKGTAKAEMKRYLKTLESVHFITQIPDEYKRSNPTVWLVGLDDFQKIVPSIVTIYAMTAELSTPQLLFWVRQMKDDGQIVLFRKEPVGYVANTSGRMRRKY